MKVMDSEQDDLLHQQNTVDAALNELRLFAGISFDQMMIIRNYLHYVYQIGHNRNRLKNPANRPVHKIKNGEIIDTYISLSEAARKTPGTSPKSISKVVRGKSNSSGGFFWKYA